MYFSLFIYQILFIKLTKYIIINTKRNIDDSKIKKKSKHVFKEKITYTF